MDVLVHDGGEAKGDEQHRNASKAFVYGRGDLVVGPAGQRAALPPVPLTRKASLTRSRPKR